MTKLNIVASSPGVLEHTVVNGDDLGVKYYKGTLEHCIVFIEGFDAAGSDYVDLRIMDEVNHEVDYHNVLSSLIERAGSVNDLTGACWDGYEAKGLKKKGNKMVPNCVPKK